ncbi:HNH endonuclease family protein [Streptomyces sp. NPDC050617]|uniref:HNH endonuclease family protein n=1 Tax=Streptomyces sp. NPDC050617 TaxID=3154628 RepID=UPI00342F48F6
MKSLPLPARLRSRRRALAGTALAGAALLAVTVTGCSPDGDSGGGNQDKSADKPADQSAGKSGSALSAVSSLKVKASGTMDGYARDRFGRAWLDTDGNHCDTRDDILKRDLTDVKFTDGHCKVASGTLTKDPYTGKTVRYVRGHSKIDIDHAVALSDAWKKGARQWSPSKRIALANDPLNLIASDASANRQKGDGDTAAWLPSNTAYRCDYVARQVSVKKKYGLWVTAAERDAMKKVLTTCPSAELPTGGNPTEAPVRFKAK